MKAMYALLLSLSAVFCSVAQNSYPIEQVDLNLRIVDCISGQPIPDSEIEINVLYKTQNSFESDVTQGISDSKGLSNLRIQLKDTIYSIVVNKAGYFMPNQIILVDRSCIQCVNEVFLLPSAQTEHIIYHDYNSADLKFSESGTVLKLLLKLLKDYENLSIQINSFADSRGSKSYNMDLSMRRAKTVVDWFLKNNVAKRQLSAVGFGESLPLNKCIDGVDCSESEYQMNRRTELRIYNLKETSILEINY